MFAEQLHGLESAALRALAFVLTYAIHSTLLLGAACLLVPRVAGSSLKLRERLWKVALFGGLVTALVQVGLGWRTPLAHWTLEPQAHTVDLPTPPPAETPSLVDEQDDASPELEARYVALVNELEAARDQQAARPVLVELLQRRTHDSTPFSQLLERAASAGEDEHAAPQENEVDDLSLADGRQSPPPVAATTAAPEVTSASVVDWRAWLAGGLAAWVVFAVLVVALFAWMWLRLARRLRGRRELVDGELRAMLDRLTLRVGGRRVRLFLAPELRTPVSFGWLRRTICIPPRALLELTRDEQESMLAHEFAHLQRRDPLWLSMAWLVERVFFFQPLNRVARAELHDLAELLCDDWAAMRTGNRVALASCLARIANWIIGSARALPATSMAGGHGRSRLGQRIERLLDERIARRDDAPRRAFVPLAVGLLTSAVFVVPGVAAASFESSVDVPDEVSGDEHGGPASDDDEMSACESPEPMPDTTDADSVALLPAPEPEAESQPAPANAAPTPAAPVAALEGDLGALDEAVVALENEIARLRSELDELDLTDELGDVIEELDARAKGLARRRARLHQLIVPTPLQLSGSSSGGQSDAPFAFQVR